MEGAESEFGSGVTSRPNRRSKQWRASINFSAIISPSRPTDEHQTSGNPTGPFFHLPPGHPLHSVRNRDSIVLPTQSQEAPQPQPAQPQTSTSVPTKAAAGNAPPLLISIEPDTSASADLSPTHRRATSESGVRDSEAGTARLPDETPARSSHRASYHHPIPGIYDRAAQLYPRRSLGPDSNPPLNTRSKFPAESTVSEEDGTDGDHDDDDDHEDLDVEKQLDAGLASSARAGQSRRHKSKLRRWWSERNFSKAR